jgi:hypothetical protein
MKKDRKREKRNLTEKFKKNSRNVIYKPKKKLRPYL